MNETIDGYPEYPKEIQCECGELFMANNAEDKTCVGCLLKMTKEEIDGIFEDEE